jgi:MoaA/NifB/PqqE/SkfB family radical SAM enzyme
MKSVALENHRYYDELNGDKDVKTLNQSNPNHPRKEDGFRLPPTILECLAAKSMYWITWDGKMLPCGTFSWPFTLPLNEGFDTAWERLPGLFEKIVPPAECQACEYGNGKCPNCPAILQVKPADLTNRRHIPVK